MILDHINNFKIDNTDNNYSNELNQLKNLEQGLSFLYNQVKGSEKKLPKIEEKCETFGWGNVPGTEGIHWGLLTCAFHWYAVSVCNYVRLIGWINADFNGVNSPRREAKKYAYEILPRVYIWRNKVAAHFARADTQEDKEIANEILSTMHQITIKNNIFYVGGLTLTLRSEAAAPESKSTLEPWSLTQIHEELADRYNWKL